MPTKIAVNRKWQTIAVKYLCNGCVTDPETGAHTQNTASTWRQRSLPDTNCRHNGGIYSSCFANICIVDDTEMIHFPDLPLSHRWALSTQATCKCILNVIYLPTYYQCSITTTGFHISLLTEIIWSNVVAALILKRDRWSHHNVIQIHTNC